MSSDTISVELTKRDVIGKRLRPLRLSGSVPAVVHNHGKESIHVMGDFVRLNKVYSQAGKHHPVQLSVDGQKHLALIKDADFDPIKNRLRHIVFQAIRQNETVNAEIPVVMAGDEVPAERKGLLILQQLDVVEVEALPRDLPDQLSVDATTLEEVGDKLQVSDIQAPAGVTILTAPDTPIVTVEMPRDQIAEADAAQASLAEDAGSTAEEAAQTSEEEATEDSADSEDTPSTEKPREVL